jgi:hypothetical protein
VAIEYFPFSSAEEEGRRRKGREGRKGKKRKEEMEEIPMQVFESLTFS